MIYPFNARWSCLANKIDVNPSFVPQVVLACAILHNFVEGQKESFSDSWNLSAQNNIEYHQPGDVNSNESIKGDATQSNDIRMALKMYLKENV